MLQVIYPSSVDCLICNGIVEKDNWLCNSCLSKIRYCEDNFIIERNKVSFNYYCLAYYSNIITELILRLKYKKDFECCYALADMMSSVVTEKGINMDRITFVPATEESMKKRGYNQSELLAKHMGKNLNLDVVNCLSKIIENKDQIGLNEEMRWKNSIDSVRLKNNKNIIGKKVLLVDDVITTGATAFCCANEIVNGGAEQVIILTAAKSKL